MHLLLDRLSLTGRINTIPALSFLALVLVVGMVGLGGSRLAGVGENLFIEALTFNRQIENFALSIERAQGMATRVPAEFDLERQGQFKAEFDKALGMSREALGALHLSNSSSFGPKLDQLAAEVDTLERYAGEVFDLASNFAQDQANAILGAEFLETELSIASSIGELRELADIENRHSLDSLNAAAWSMTWQALLVGLVTAAMALFLSLFVGRSITRPLRTLNHVMTSLANGNLEAEIPNLARSDEIGSMTRTVQIFKDNAIEMRGLQQEQAAADEQAKAMRQQMLDELEEHIGSVVSSGVAGDLSRRVAVTFDDPVLQRLADGVNRFVEVVDQGLDENCVALTALANGDLTQEVKGDYRGAFKNLKDATNATTRKLANVVAQIHAATNKVEDAATDIAGSAADLSGRTEQAADDLKTTTASTEQMAATVRKNAKNATSANHLADDANRTASQGGRVVEQAVAAMSDIEESAQKIADIVVVIDEIAFQTNLLALNASVEAARAGEAGKGFAVVAQEVRQLAQRAAGAASDIKALINNSNGQVKVGVQLVSQTGESLTNIVSSIGKVVGIVREISAASQEQASGIQDINSSVVNLDNITQQNSALVGENTSAARALSDEAGRLTELMAFFDLTTLKPL